MMLGKLLIRKAVLTPGDAFESSGLNQSTQRLPMHSGSDDISRSYNGLLAREANETLARVGMAHVAKCRPKQTNVNTTPPPMSDDKVVGEAI